MHPYFRHPAKVNVLAQDLEQELGQDLHKTYPGRQDLVQSLVQELFARDGMYM